MSEEHNVADAEPSDIYADKNGKLWRVQWACREPSLSVVEIEPANPLATSSKTMSGGISGLQWDGFTRIYRPK